MNGAMADPLVSTISAPNPTRATITGSSQNFLRWLRNPQRSRRNSMASVRFVEVAGHEDLYELVQYRDVAALERSQPQRVVAEQSADDADGCDDQIEHRRQQHLRHDGAQHVREAEPHD